MTREERLEAALRDAVRQIEYLHDKFQPTGSGNAVLAQCRAALDAPPAAEERETLPPHGPADRGPFSNVPMDPAERGFVGAVYGPAGEWRPTNPEDDGDGA